MPIRPSVFKFGTFVVRVSDCDYLTLEPCVPPSCSNYSICWPGGRTLARLKFDPRSTDPAEFKELVAQVQRLGLEVEVVVPADLDNPGAGTGALGRALDR